jgi:hypothetical protein
MPRQGLSLKPRFSGVLADTMGSNRFSGFHTASKNR